MPRAHHAVSVPAASRRWFGSGSLSIAFRNFGEVGRITLRPELFNCAQDMGWVGLFANRTQRPSALANAVAISEVGTPNCHAASARESPSGVALLVGSETTSRRL
jgi:hypothetical protein